MITIGYKDLKGESLKFIVENIQNKLKINECRFIPLSSSHHIISFLNNNEINYGLIAIKDNRNGYIKESAIALYNIKYDVVLEEKVKVNETQYVTFQLISLIR